MFSFNRFVSVVAMLFVLVSGSTAGASYSIGVDAYDPAGVIAADRQILAKATVYDSLYDDKPLADGSYNFVSLGFGGSIILTMLGGDAIVNGADKDFTLYETTYGENADVWGSYKETAEVFAYNGIYDPKGNDWFSLGFASQDGAFNLGKLLFTTAIKIVDVSRENGFSGEGDGYDVDGIVVHNVGRPVPIPGAALLLGSGLLGLVGLRRRQIV